ncbi:MAG: hypothetical protein K8H90_07920, partial [Thermoanaerobaculia bacterium]|nr:hypothetical protein [Thermoanaerobaculia bacterium]
HRKTEELGLELSRVYLRMARVEPKVASLREIRTLRASEFAPLRAAGVLLCAQRWPAAFLKRASKLFSDRAPEVREAVLDGLVCATVQLPLSEKDQNAVMQLLDAASRDESDAVRAASEDTAVLLGM